MKKSLKKWLYGAAIAVFVLFVSAHILLRTLYLPGVHFIGRYCSINEEFTCYWYDTELQEFTGETSEISLKVTGLSGSSDKIWGTLAIEGYEMEKHYENASDAKGRLFYDHELFSSSIRGELPGYRYAKISHTDYYVAYRTDETTGIIVDSSPGVGCRYTLYFDKEHTDCVRVVIEDEYGAIRIGYCADSLEEAKAVQQHYRNWKE